MRILERYITQSIIQIFVAATTVCVLLYLVIDVANQLDEFIDRGVPLKVLIEYYLKFLPIILVQTSPFICLISVMLTFSTLNNANEIVVMRSSGLNFWQIAKPALFFAITISVLVFWLNEHYVPRATEMTRNIRNEHMILAVDRERMKKEKIQNLTFYGLKNRLYYIQSFDPMTNTLEGISIIEFDERLNERQKIDAPRGVWAGALWKFYNVTINTFAPPKPGEPKQIPFYREKLMDIKESPKDFLQQRLNVNAMNIKQLRQYINRFSRSGATKAINNLKVDYYYKLAYPLMTLVIVFTGMPFAIFMRSRKGNTFTSIGVALLIGFFYYVSNSVCVALGKGDGIPPLLSAFLAPILFSGLTIILIKSKF